MLDFIVANLDDIEVVFVVVIVAWVIGNLIWGRND